MYHLYAHPAACISGSIGKDARWPRFGAAAARLEVNSATSLPLVLGEQLIGAINAYAYTSVRERQAARHRQATGRHIGAPRTRPAGAGLTAAIEGLDHAGGATFIVAMAARIAGRESGWIISRRETAVR